MKSPRTTNSKWLFAGLALITVGIAIGFVFFQRSDKKLSWESAQSFKNNRFLVSVEKTTAQNKNATEDLFLVHIYDFTTNQYLEDLKIPIAADMAYQSEYIGFSNHYLWLKTPDMIAVDMLSPNHSILAFNDLKKQICSQNPEDFKDLIDLVKVDNYLKATNQNGDQFFVNLETFKTTKIAPVGYYYSYHKSYTIMDQLPKFIPGSQYTKNFYVASVGTTDYRLKVTGEPNSIKRTFFSLPNDSTYQVLKVSAADSIRNAHGAVPHVVTISPKEKPLTDLSFIRAVGLGVSNNQFVFRYKKVADKTAPWYLAWFDLKTNSVSKEINLESKGLKPETASDTLSHWISIDGKWAFFAISNKTPVRIQLN